MREKNNRALSLIMIVTLIASAAILSSASNLPYANAATPTILVTGANGNSINYSLVDLMAMPNVTMYGGYYQPNQHTVNSGLWTGVSVQYLCNLVGGITSDCNITVTGQGVNVFNYDMVNSGINFNLGYKTYNNVTGALQNQTQPIIIVLAYQVNGTDLPSGMQPDPRLVIVGPEGLLFDGSGGRSVTQVNVTGTAPTPTPTPSPTPTPTPSPTPSPTPTATPTTTPTPTMTPTPTPTQTPTVTPTPNPTSITATTGNGTIVSLTLGGNVTSSQMSNVTIAANQSAATTTLSFSLTGTTGTVGFGNVTIPKSAVPYGATPTVYIDNQTAQDQNYTQDSNNYYVWYTVHFSTHQVDIVFTAPTPTSSPTPTEQPTASPSESPTLTATPAATGSDNTLTYVIIGIVVIVVVVVAVALLMKRRK